MSPATVKGWELGVRNMNGSACRIMQLLGECKTGNDYNTAVRMAREIKR
ncbi:MAG: hypothetical protein PF495_13290 [Spirochaetales bacterium]|nr:hypothetical protein [Spirochaetales bacterium]